MFISYDYVNNFVRNYISVFPLFLFLFIFFILIIFFNLKDITVVFIKVNKFIRVRPFIRFRLSELAVSPPSLKWPGIQSLNKNKLNINLITLN